MVTVLEHVIKSDPLNGDFILQSRKKKILGTPGTI